MTMLGLALVYLGIGIINAAFGPLMLWDDGRSAGLDG